ncbi:hypothetical protein HanIR_Chr01g0008231 [Helianthus annuus]|nr:hypothetical protein HanIR_Chr01g0008231 [Helianthus annuus]
MDVVAELNKVFYHFLKLISCYVLIHILIVHFYWFLVLFHFDFYMFCFNKKASYLKFYFISQNYVCLTCYYTSSIFLSMVIFIRFIYVRLRTKWFNFL